jgi:periplasmic protein TonB
MKTLAIIICVSIICIAQEDTSNKVVNYSEIIEVFGVAPQLIGGIDSLQSRLQYPREALEKGIEGTVYVSIAIDTLGIPSSLKILKGLGFGCDEEAQRLVETAKYLPAIQAGKKIKSNIMIPVKFKLPSQ